MTRTRKALAALAASALIGPTAVVTALGGPAAADADGKHRHDIDTYKREAWLAIGGPVNAASATTAMLCDSGDYALDGMWKVDAHDGDDATVYAEYSRRDSGVKERWEFKLINQDPSKRAQVKTFVTCLDSTTGARDGHTHTILEGARTDDLSADTTTPGLAILEASCAAGEIPVSPSFALAPGDTARLVESYPLASTGWKWVFEGGTGTAKASIYCLESTTSSASSGPAHTHDIDADLLKLDNQAVAMSPTSNTDFRLSARPHDEGNVGAFRIDNPLTSSVVYLGQDAQGQVRGFRFGRYVASADGTVDLAVWGFDKRTKKNS